MKSLMNSIIKALMINRINIKGKSRYRLTGYLLFWDFNESIVVVIICKIGYNTLS